MKHLAVPAPLASGIEDPRTAGLATGGYCPRLSIQLMKEQMDARSQELPFSSQPPQYTPAYGMDNPHSPTTKLCPGYLKWLSLVPRFEPPTVCSGTETVPARVTQVQEEVAKGQLSAPHLGIWNPVDSTFPDALHRREIGPLSMGHPNPPHLPDLPRGGPPNPLGPPALTFGHKLIQQYHVFINST